VSQGKRRTEREKIGDMVAGLEAHVWILPVEAMPALPRHALECLSAEELERAGRIIEPVMRERFLRSRAALRALLSTCTGTVPAQLAFGRTGRGKPVLLSGNGIDFSISHSRGLVAVAMATCPTGVDVEHLRTPLHLERTARRILHPQTVALLAGLADGPLVDAFIGAWTLREAHVKAVGGGLFHTPDTLPFDVAVPADGVLREVTGRDGSTWSAARFTPTADTRAAVVLQGTGYSLVLHDAARTLERIAEVYDDRS
jgi:4'-phosphopantetheinyl transferase